MSAYWTSIERFPGPSRPIKRPKGPQALTFLFTFLQPATFAFLGSIPEQPMHAATRKHPPAPAPAFTIAESPAPKTPPPQEVENIFIDALVQASVGRHHTRHPTPHPWTYSLTHSYHKARRRYYDNARQIRHMHRKAVSAPKSPLSREDYLNLVDVYREPFSTQAMDQPIEPLPPWKSTSNLWPRSAAPSAPNQPTEGCWKSSSGDFEVTVPEEIIQEPDPLISTENTEQFKQPISTDSSQSRQKCVEELLNVLAVDDCTHEAAFEAYSNLPSPGVSLLSRKEIRLLFRRLSVVEQKSRDSMLRYLSVVDDMKATDLDMTEAEWNSAIAFCGRCYAIVKAAAVEDALRTWKEMEHEAGVKSGNVTFNILFDIATKAGKFVLAEMILKEMQARDLPVNRYARVGLIYFHGLQGDGDGVRQAYREFVEAGEIVDTVVINCVIASLIRAGEPASAEQIYERMKSLLLRREDPWILPQYSWRATRDLGRSLARAASYFRYHPLRLQQIREEQSLAPDLHTYSIFIDHHASTTGELRRITILLTEMKHLGVPMHSRIFLKIFKGFAFHGGIRYTSWTKARLESVWNALLDALDEENDVKIMKWMVVWTMRAFDRCAGRERTMQIWDELRKRWEPGGGELEDVLDMCQGFLKLEQGS